MKKHHVLRALFGAYITLGIAFVAHGAVSIVSSQWIRGTGDGAVVLNMRVVKNRWQWDPGVIVVPYGALVTLDIVNEDSFDHGFAITAFNLDRRLPGNGTTTMQFVANIEGEFEYFCSVYCGAGHFDQKGKLVVTREDPEVVLARYTRASTTNLPLRSRADALDRLPFTIDEAGVKVFELTAEHIMWDYGDGKVVESWGYNGQLPGPEIRVLEGDTVRINFTNNLPVPTTVHWHGVDLVNSMDGVPGYTQPAVQPGETFVYEFQAHPAGTRFYHTHGSSHGDEALQLDMGLAGAFIIEPRRFERPDVDYTMVLTERIRHGIYPINGAIYPATEFITVRAGDRVRVRMINAGSSTFHPMHLHGHQFKVVATDGNPVPEVAQLTRNTLPLLPGETYDVEFIANNNGVWLFHCHELQHAGNGMITAVVYEDAIGGGFNLTDHTNRQVTEAQFIDGYTLITFGYTNCPDVCGFNMADVATAIRLVDEEFGTEVAVNGLFVTIDPARDTPEVIRPYVQSYSDRITGLTGTAEEIAAIAAAYNVNYEAVVQSGGYYSMDHSTGIFLLGPGGRYVAQFAYGSGPQRIAAAVRRDVARQVETAQRITARR